MRGILIFIGALAAFAPVGAEARCDLDLAEATLRVGGQVPTVYLRVLDALAERLPDDADVMALVRRGYFGRWCDDARRTLEQNPRLHRVFFPWSS